MKAYRFIRLVAVMIAVILALSAAASCSSGNNGTDPAETDDPSAQATETGGGDTVLTESPVIDTEVPDATISPVDPTEVPDDSASPDTTEPASSTSQPDATSAPEATQQPSDTHQPDQTPLITEPAATAESTFTPAPSYEPTEVPEPDPVTELTFIESDKTYRFDMNFDGIPERIEVRLKTRDTTKQCTVRVTVGGSGETLIDTFDTERLMVGLVNNFNTGDNRAELMLSTLTGNRDALIKSYRLNGESSGLLLCETEGWIDSVNGNSVIVSKYVDLMGTWECFCEHSFAFDSFELLPVWTDWMVKPEEGRMCTLAEEIMVGLYVGGPDNYVGFMEAGDKLYPTATDLSERIDFVTDTNVSGYLSVTFGSDGRPLLDGEPMDSLFTDLTFIQ